MKGAPLLFALAAALLVGCSEPPQEPGKISVSLDNESPLPGATVRMTALAENLGADSIVLEYGEERRSFGCDEPDRCSAEVSFTVQRGVYLVRATAVAEGGGRIASDSGRVSVASGRAGACLDSTPEGACSQRKPMLCGGGVLREACSVCGCASGFYCGGGACLPSGGAVNFANVSYPRIVEAGKEFAIAMVIDAAGSAAGAKYVAEARIGGKVYSQDFSIGDGGRAVVSIGRITLAAGEHDLNISVFAFSPEKTPAGWHYAADAVVSAENLGQPETPSIAYVFAEGGSILIGWSEVANAASYVVYRSFDSNPAYVAYRKDKEVQAPETSAVVDVIGPGSHLFTVTAVDAFGNESGFSAVKGVTIGG